MDDYATHETKPIRGRFAKHPRWHVHFTPTGASWINQVERIFALLTFPYCAFKTRMGLPSRLRRVSHICSRCGIVCQGQCVQNAVYPAIGGFDAPICDIALAGIVHAKQDSLARILSLLLHKSEGARLA